MFCQSEAFTTTRQDSSHLPAFDSGGTASLRNCSLMIRKQHKLYRIKENVNVVIFALTLTKVAF